MSYPGRRSAMRAAGGLMLCVLLSATQLWAGDAAPVPVRAPSPELGPEPWPGYRPVAPGRVPLAAMASLDRWRLYRSAVASGAMEVHRTTSPVAVPPRPETEAVERAWAAAVEAALQDRPTEVLDALNAARPTTLDGQRRARELAFAAAVALGDRQAADSLFYRLAFHDGGATTRRLAAWRALEDRDPARLATTLPVPGQRSPGEEAVMAFAIWMDDPGTAQDGVAVVGSGLDRAALGLVRAHADQIRGDARSTTDALSAIPPASLPAVWRPTADALAAWAGNTAEGSVPETPDRVAYRELGLRFLEGNDAAALRGADTWLATWTASPLRGHVYLVRAHLEIAAGNPAAALSDLRTARERGEGLGARDTGWVEIFALAGSGQTGEALERIGALESAPGSASLEPEILFHRARLLRASGAPEDADLIGLRLEEGYPDSPWSRRLATDVDPAQWREPWRVVPSEPVGRARIEAPEQGPWARLLWGEEILAETAVRLTTPAPVAESPSLASNTTTTPRDAGSPRLLAGVRGGAPIALLLELGAGGVLRDMHYHWAARQTLADARHGLPSYDRTDLEAAVGWTAASASVGVAGDVTRRHDGAAGDLGLNPDATEADWIGGRVDVELPRVAPEGTTLGVSVVRGDLDAGVSGSWRTDQVWVDGRSALDVAGRILRLDVTGAILRHQQGGESRTGHGDVRGVLEMNRGLYVGVRASGYGPQAMLLPVAGIEGPLSSTVTGWARTEPRLIPLDFRTTFVTNGDFNTPDLSLLAVRRDVDLSGGVRWAPRDRFSLGTHLEAYRESDARTWKRDGAFFREVAVDQAVGTALGMSAEAGWSAFDLSLRGTGRRVTVADEPLAYVPTFEGSASLAWHPGPWRVETSTLLVSGRRDDTGVRYGDFVRWDVEAAYRYRAPGLPLGARWMELALRVENLTNVQDVRWPGVPAYGFGIYAGVRLVTGN